MKHFPSLVVAICSLTSCFQSNVEYADLEEKKVTKSNENLESMLSEYISTNPSYKRIACPDYANDDVANVIPVCYFGVGAIEEFQEFITPEIDKRADSRIFWGSDYGFWHASAKFTSLNGQLGIIVHKRDTSDDTMHDPNMHGYDIFIKLLFR